MPTHGSQDRRFGKLGDSRRRDDGHVAGVHAGKAASSPASLKRKDSDFDLRPPEDTPVPLLTRRSRGRIAP
jgi:hypothetical protein